VDLQFGSGLLALTQERLLACDPKTQQWVNGPWR
jgi:ATP-binding cassette subfamily B protein